MQAWQPGGLQLKQAFSWYKGGKYSSMHLFDFKALFFCQIWVLSVFSKEMYKFTSTKIHIVF